MGTFHTIGTVHGRQADPLPATVAAPSANPDGALFRAVLDDDLRSAGELLARGANPAAARFPLVIGTGRCVLSIDCAPPAAAALSSPDMLALLAGGGLPMDRMSVRHGSRASCVSSMSLLELAVEAGEAPAALIVAEALCAAADSAAEVHSHIRDVMQRCLRAEDLRESDESFLAGTLLLARFGIRGAGAQALVDTPVLTSRAPGMPVPLAYAYLMGAARNRVLYTKCARALAAAGYSYEHQFASAGGATALTLAAADGDIDTVNSLLVLGADPDRADGRGMTAATAASRRSLRELIQSALDAHRAIRSASGAPPSPARAGTN